MIVSSVVAVLCPCLCLTVETHNGTTVFPVGPVAVFISPVKPFGFFVRSLASAVGLSGFVARLRP